MAVESSVVLSVVLYFKTTWDVLVSDTVAFGFQRHAHGGWI
jgi:hypothetical protein